MPDDPRGQVRVEQSAKRVRTYLGGELLADSIHPRLVWEKPQYPAYYLPREDVRTELLTPSSRTEHSPSRGTAQYFHVKGGDRLVEDGARAYPESPCVELRDLIRFDFRAMDAWFEEDEPIGVHPRDPYTRVDVLASSRHVEVAINRVKVAETSQPRILFETGLPPRYYIPLTDVRMDLLRASGSETQCPYKGTANYWSVQAGDELAEDVVWTYRTPLLESVKIAGLVCFYNERVDLTVDGVLQERPQTAFSPRRAS